MRHRKHNHQLGVKSAHRVSLVANLSCSLIEHGRIKTTLAKARALRPAIEKIITLAKKAHVTDDAARKVHYRRLAIARLRKNLQLQFRKKTHRILLHLKNSQRRLRLLLPMRHSPKHRTVMKPKRILKALLNQLRKVLNQVLQLNNSQKIQKILLKTKTSFFVYSPMPRPFLFGLEIHVLFFLNLNRMGLRAF